MLCEVCVILQTASTVLLLTILSILLSYVCPTGKKDDFSRCRKNNGKKDDITALNRKKGRPFHMSTAYTVKNVTADQ